MTELTEIAEMAEVNEIAETVKTFFTNHFVNVCVKLVVAGLILIIGLWIVSIISKLIKKGVILRRADASVRGFADSAVSLVFKILVVITAAAYLGVPMASVITVLGSVGLALGLALQGGLSNVAGGVILILSRPFSIGDYVTVGNKSGTVKHIGIYYTTLVTPDNQKIVIPNGVVTGNEITDFSAGGTRRLDLNFNVAYSSDTDAVRAALLKVADANNKIMKSPAPEVVMAEHGDSAVKFSLRVWIKTEDYWDVQFRTIEDVKRAFDNAGIHIPFPQIDVHFDDKDRID